MNAENGKNMKVTIRGEIGKQYRTLNKSYIQSGFQPLLYSNYINRFTLSSFVPACFFLHRLNRV